MNVLVTSKTDTSYRNVHKVTVNDGRLTTTRYRVYEKEYKFSNKGSKDIADMFLEHRFYKVQSCVCVCVCVCVCRV
jgi:hypothetical protein